MPLTVQLAGDTHSAVQVFRTLAEGRPLAYSAVVLPTAAGRVALATAVLGGPVTLTIAADTESLHDGPLQLTGCRETRFGVEVTASPAAVVAPSPRAIDRPATAADVLRAVADLVAVPTAVANELSAIPLPLGANTCFIQDGGTPAERLSAALASLAALHPDDPRLMLGVVSNPGGTPPLRVVWTDRRAYEKSQTLDAHRLTFDADDGREDITFATRDDRPVVVRTRRDRPFTPAGWRRWCGRGFPAFDAAAVSWGVTDRLFDTGDGRVGWDTAVTWGVVGERHRPRPVGWAGVGVVDGWDAPWLRVRLPGFASGRDRGVALLNAASTGADGRTGLHLLPAPDSEVSLSWSGRLDEPLLFDGNVRREAPAVAAPAAVFDDPMTVRAPELNATADTAVMSTKTLRAKASDTLTAEAGKEATMTGGGGKACCKNGTFQAGK